MGAFLVDSNVLVYAYDQSEGRKRQRAIEVLEAVATGQAGFLSTQILGEFFVTATRKIPSPLSLREASTVVTRYIESWSVIHLTAALVLEALRGVEQHQLHYYDALVWAAAKLHQVQEILTEDGQHGRLIEGVRYLNPFDDKFDMAVLSA